MTTTKQTDIRAIVKRTSELARLSLPPEEEERFIAKARALLDYVEQLGELDTTGIEPTAHAVAFAQVLREDVPIASEKAATILEAAPERDGPYVQVPKVIDSEQ